MDVRVVKDVDPAKPTDSVFGPRKGYHFLAVQLELTNSGATTYSDTPAKGAALIDNKLHQYDADITDPVGPGFGSPRIAPRSQARRLHHVRGPRWGDTDHLPVQTGLRARSGHGAMVALGPLYDRR
jgi:hypothetical protein